MDAALLDKLLNGGVISAMFVLICLWAMTKAWPQFLAERKEGREHEAQQAAADRTAQSEQQQRLLAVHAEQREADRQHWAAQFALIAQHFERATTAFERAAGCAPASTLREAGGTGGK